MSLSVKQRWEIVFLHVHPHGPTWQQRRIARYLHVSESAVRYWIRRYEATGDVTEQEKTGRHRKTTKSQDKMISKVLENNPEESLPSIAEKLKTKGISLSSSTIRRRVLDLGFQYLPPLKKPLLSTRHRDQRLEWAKEHGDTDWSAVIFTDEATFSLFRSTKRSWQMKGHRTVFRTVKHPAKVHIWACFSANGFGKCYLFTGNLNAERMCKIYSKALLKSVDTLIDDESDWVLQEDNDPKHTSNRCKQWKLQNGITRMSWPAMSPDMNPMENVWSVLKCRVAYRKPRKLSSLVRIIQQEWKSLPVEYAKKLVESMPNRIKCLLNADGDFTKY
jgi:transposase